MCVRGGHIHGCILVDYIKHAIFHSKKLFFGHFILFQSFFFRAIIVSFKILPKILSVYPHASNSADSAKILTWAIKELDLMKYFFENLKEFTKLWPTEKENDELVSDREQQIQSRLDFLSAMYSNEITPDHFRKYYCIQFITHPCRY